MAALFACTKCHSRHPFDQLSSSEQLCKVRKSDETQWKIVTHLTCYISANKTLSKPIYLKMLNKGKTKMISKGFNKNMFTQITVNRKYILFRFGHTVFFLTLCLEYKLSAV